MVFIKHVSVFRVLDFGCEEAKSETRMDYFRVLPSTFRMPQRRRNNKFNRRLNPTLVFLIDGWQSVFNQKL